MILSFVPEETDILVSLTHRVQNRDGCRRPFNSLSSCLDSPPISSPLALSTVAAQVITGCRTSFFQNYAQHAVHQWPWETRQRHRFRHHAKRQSSLLQTALMLPSPAGHAPVCYMTLIYKRNFMNNFQLSGSHLMCWWQRESLHCVCVCINPQEQSRRRVND